MNNNNTLLTFWILLCGISSCVNSYCQTEISYKSIEVIPQPNSVILKPGTFILENEISIYSAAKFETAKTFLVQYLEQIGFKTNKQHTPNSIAFIFDNNIENNEGYELFINPNNIEIKSRTEAGAFYAVQTLIQIFQSAKNSSLNSIPLVNIKDHPKFPYRGMHLDVSRHFFSTDFIKKYIDALAMLKINTFHWHLTDDQGWRIEIKRFPKLQITAAFRDETLIGHYNNEPHQFDGIRYGGYYSQEEIKDIVAYAKKRQITIIPEIEMPGHSQAAIAAYPYLSCEETPTSVAQKWGVFETILCTKEPVFDFLESVLDEVVNLFPGPYIHIGGDEAPKTKWKHCVNCQKRIQTEQLESEEELQAYFIQRIENYLKNKGKKIIGWDEILEGGLGKNAVVMSWRGMEGGIAAAKQGNFVIMTPTSHCYFDYYQSENEDEPLAIGGYLPLKKVYNFNPIPNQISKDEEKFILGGQANLWTEYMTTTKQVEYMMFPRILALSEVLWTNPELKNFEYFIQRSEAFIKTLNTLGYHFANHFHDIKGRVFLNQNKLYLELSKSSKKHNIFFTAMDASPEFSEENRYISPILIDKTSTIKAVSLDETGNPLGKQYTETINLHKGVGQHITLSTAPSPTYSGSGAFGLINGVDGNSKRYGDKEWLGFWGEDVSITIDLQQTEILSEISTRFFNANGQWIYAPKKVVVNLFDDNGQIILTKEILSDQFTSNGELTTHATLKFKPMDTKKITLTVVNYGKIPDGKQGAGQKAWTFIDEIKLL